MVSNKDQAGPFRLTVARADGSVCLVPAVFTSLADALDICQKLIRRPGNAYVAVTVISAVGDPVLRPDRES